MKKIFMVVAMLVTLCNVSLGIAYACTCSDSYGGCWATGTGAECYKDSKGMCHCKDGVRNEEELLLD